jgi:hypothetical protein
VIQSGPIAVSDKGGASSPGRDGVAEQGGASQAGAGGDGPTLEQASNLTEKPEAVSKNKGHTGFRSAYTMVHTYTHTPFTLPTTPIPSPPDTDAMVSHPPSHTNTLTHSPHHSDHSLIHSFTKSKSHKVTQSLISSLTLSPNQADPYTPSTSPPNPILPPPHIHPAGPCDTTHGRPATP